MRMSESFTPNYNRSLRRRKRFEQSLESQNTIVIEGGVKQVSEPYVILMQLIARGYFNQEILLNPHKAHIFVDRLIKSGVEFPRTCEWDVTVTQRRIIRAMQGSRSVEQVLKRIKTDSSIRGVRKQINSIKRAGRGRELTDLPDFT